MVDVDKKNRLGMPKNRARWRGDKIFSQARGMDLSPMLRPMLRVDHAGELGAVSIYEGQLALARRRARQADNAARTPPRTPPRPRKQASSRPARALTSKPSAVTSSIFSKNCRARACAPHYWAGFGNGRDEAQALARRA